MKRGRIISLGIIALYVCGLTGFSYAQTENNVVTKEERNVEAFSTLNVGETFIITYTPADDYKVIVESNENKLSQITTEVVGGTLNIKNKHLRSPGVLNVFITAPFFTDINLSGASEFYSKGEMNVDSIKIEISGAAKAELNLKSKHLNLIMHGASELGLQGTAAFMEARIEGTAVLNATNLEVTNAKFTNHSQAISNLNVNGKLEITSYRTSKVTYAVEPQEIIEHNISIDDRSRRTFSINNSEEGYYSNRSRSGFGRINFSVGEREDSTIVVLGRHQFIIDEYGNARYHKIYRKRFNGHWGGIDIGINGYLTPDYDMNFPDDYDYLDLNLGSSTRFDLNLFEQNLPISKNKHWGFITGIGFEFRNYNFDNAITLISDLDEITGYTITGTAVKKNKLMVSYVNIPFIFEYQTNSYGEQNSFHISVGMVLGLRYASKTKTVFENRNSTFDLFDTQGNYVETLSYDKKKVKGHNSYHLNPIKADAMFRIGWGWFNFYATYSLTEMFKKNEGPELYPFSFGMTILKW